MALPDRIDALRNGEPLNAAAVAGLSGLAMGEVGEAAEAWVHAPPERRRELVERMVEMAEANVDLEFDAFLCHALTDTDAAVRERAAAGLWETDDRRVALQLLAALGADPSAAVRAAAARSLGHFALLAETGKLLERDRDHIYQG
ncbi:MAG: HEAT repeat domain-containing protein, partial [Chloroflexota bacterium]|nr:HEAT repeat domain-containing protein [Chloroflexota bacterium]